MATFLQWDRTRPVRRVTWVCGPEPVLTAEVVRSHRERLSSVPYRALYAERSENTERTLWDDLLSFPPGGRLAVVYGAEKLAAVHIGALLDSAPEFHTTVFVSADHDFERVDGALAPHLAAIQASRNGQLIRCNVPSRAEDQVKLVASWWPGATRAFASELLGRCGTLAATWQACEKGTLAGLPAELSSFEYVVRREAIEVYADKLVAGQRRDAMDAARQLTTGEVGRALGQLAWRLDVLGVLRAAQDKGLEPYEVQRRYHLDLFIQKLYGPHASSYSHRRRDRCRELLAMADSAWHCGTAEGVAEAVAALW
jgi:hypothetical protein